MGTGGDPPDMAPTHRQRAAHLQMPLRDPILRAPKTQTSCLCHGAVRDVVSERPLEFFENATCSMMQEVAFLENSGARTIANTPTASTDGRKYVACSFIEN